MKIEELIYIKEESIVEKDRHCNIAHEHKGVELIYTMHGMMNCQVGTEEFQLKKGDLCFINRKQLHNLSCIKGEACEHKVMIIDLPGLIQNQTIFEQYIQPLIEDQSFAHIRFEGNSSCAAIIGEDIIQIEKAMNEKKCGYGLEISSLVQHILFQLYVAYCNRPKEKMFMHPHKLIFDQMLEYISMQYGEEIGLNDIAEAGNVSRSQCIKIFKEYIQQSPITYLNSYRLESSRNLLRATNDAISSIALACGFREQSYFNKLFLREYGCTPNEYRRQK